MYEYRLWDHLSSFRLLPCFNIFPSRNPTFPFEFLLFWCSELYLSLLRRSFRTDYYYAHTRWGINSFFANRATHYSNAEAAWFLKGFFHSSFARPCLSACAICEKKRGNAEISNRAREFVPWPGNPESELEQIWMTLLLSALLMLWFKHG